MNLFYSYQSKTKGHQNKDTSKRGTYLKKGKSLSCPDQLLQTTNAEINLKKENVDGILFTKDLTLPSFLIPFVMSFEETI